MPFFIINLFTFIVYLFLFSFPALPSGLIAFWRCKGTAISGTFKQFFGYSSRLYTTNPSSCDKRGQSTLFLSQNTILLGEVDDEAAAGGVGGVEGEGAAQVDDVATGQRQTQAQAFRQVVDLGEGHKHQVAIFLGYARTCVLEDETDGVGRF